MCIRENEYRYEIRLARPDERLLLREIEDEAGRLFSGLGLVDEALDSSFPLHDLDQLIMLGQVWVGAEKDGRPVGMIIVSIRETIAYIEEMDVLPAHGRRGLGTCLLAHACNWARQRRYEAAALSTFTDVPWNGPFYRKNGFRALPAIEWTPWMQTVRDREKRRGLDIDRRVFMQKRFRASDATTSSAATT